MLNSREGIATWLFGFCDMSVEAELPRQRQIDYLTEALGNTPEKLLEYLDLAAAENSQCDLHVLEEPQLNGYTIFGVSLAKIAKWILSFQPMGKTFDFDDQTHYQLLATEFKKAPGMLMYYLGNAAENAAS